MCKVVMKATGRRGCFFRILKKNSIIKPLLWEAMQLCTVAKTITTFAAIRKKSMFSIVGNGDITLSQAKEPIFLKSKTIGEIL